MSKLISSDTITLLEDGDYFWLYVDLDVSEWEPEDLVEDEEDEEDEEEDGNPYGFSQDDDPWALDTINLWIRNSEGADVRISTTGIKQILHLIADKTDLIGEVLKERYEAEKARTKQIKEERESKKNDSQT